MIMKYYSLLLFAILFAGFSAHGTIIHVPGNYAQIQSAINASTNGDTILVDHGVYFENINFRGKNILLAGQYLFTHDPADITATVINGSLPLHTDTASCVLIISGETSAAVLQGFTITKGKGTRWADEHSAGTYREGGGILVALSSPTIKNNYIVDNEASDKFNSTSAGGGGIRAGDGNPTILNNVIIRNTGLYGGGIVLNFTGVTMKNNIVAQNTGGQDFGGAGIWVNGNGTAAKLIENNTIADNVTIGNDGGGLLIQSASVTARNNIIWGNSATTGPQISVAVPGASLAINFSDVQGGWPGGNINQNPLFNDTSYYLSPSSPAIDAGNSSSVYNDPENGSNPGFALFPSRGTVRNDMGAHGGPGSTNAVYVDQHLDDPKPPTSTTAYSDYQTPRSVAVRWHDPSLRNNGAPLTNFKIQVYRNATLIAVVDSGIQLFVDTGLVKHGSYHYDINAVVPNDSSIVDSATAYAGGNAQSKPPTNFSVLDGNAGTVLSWINPSQQLDGTPLNDFAFILIYRNGVLIDSMAQSSSDTLQQRTYLDTTAGYHFFRIRARDNESPRNFSTLTDSLLGFGKIQTTYRENFEQGAGLIYRTGAWDTTSQIAYSGTHAFTDSRTGNYSMNSETSFLLPTIILGSQCILTYRDIAIVRPGSFAMIDVSTNHRNNFLVLKYYDWSAHTQWGDASADNGDWANELIDLSPYAGDTATIRFRLITSGQSPVDGWYIDSMFVGPANPVVTNNYSENASWNMLSLPLTVGNGNKNMVYPTAVSQAFSYEGNYRAHDSLTIGVGYWMKFDSAVTVPVTGAMFPRDTINVRSGWNMIGTISTEIDSASVITIPQNILHSSFYTYSGGYVSTGTLIPGKSYWVKTSQAGKIILSLFAAPGQQPVQIAKHELPLVNKLTFSDQQGHTQDLLFTDDRTVSSDRYELPPLPPADGFDVRFASQRMLALADERGKKEFPVSLQSVGYPLTVSWHIATPMNGSSVVINGKEHSLSTNGSITVSQPDSRVILQLKGSHGQSVPKEFALLQNYPNPFNPSTNFRFSISEPGMVSFIIYDVLGRAVATLVQDELYPGTYSKLWDATTNASGMYYARMIVTNQFGKQLYQETKKLLLLR